MKRRRSILPLAVVLLMLSTSVARLARASPSLAGTWSLAPSMPAPVMSSQAVLLNDGRVLVMGGESVLGVPTAVTQAYDPSTRLWRTVASMHTARIGFTATVLRDGRVLVVGGIGSTMNDLASAEVFDPGVERWTMLPALPQPRFSQSASLLADGRVLLVGGIVNHTISPSTLLFEPAHNVFVYGPPTHLPHAQQCALMLSPGFLLIAGGYGGGPERYDTASNAWEPAGFTPARIRPTLTLLQDGSALLAGGTNRHERDLSTAVIFHPNNDRWSTTGPLSVPRHSGIGGLLPDGEVLVAGGEQVNEHLLRTAELYSSRLRTWAPAAPMNVARSGATSTVLHDGSLLVCGGSGFAGTLSSCERFHASTVSTHSSPTGDVSDTISFRLHRGTL